MIWLELRKHNIEYNTGWNFSESVWAPTRKKNGSKWPYWGMIENVVKGDIIFHLRYGNGEKRFLGYSTANSDGYVTNNLPTNDAHDWSYSKAYYKVDLIDYTPLEIPVELSNFFLVHDVTLRETYKENKENRLLHQHIFYTIQKGKLQSLFGAYFSEFNENLFALLKGNMEDFQQRTNINDEVKTGAYVRAMEQRIGQQEFSDNVKKNYGNVCCFPKCQVSGRAFLIGGHINRWADDEGIRGRTDNGLCMCLMHDKAFEKGFFTLDEKYKIEISMHHQGEPWIREFLELGKNLEIKPRRINPSIDALSAHWRRIGRRLNPFNSSDSPASSEGRTKPPV